MSKVSWIKLDVDMYKNEKIRLLRRMSGGGTRSTYIWAVLLMMAGKSNAGGRLMLSQSMPYTPEMLAAEMELPTDAVVETLEIMMQLDMVKKKKNILEICDWENHQNEDKLARMREANRLRQQRYRERKKQEEKIGEVIFEEF